MSNQSTRNSIQSLGRECQIWTCDLSDADAVSELTPRILADGHKITILLNSAGIQHRCSSEDFRTDDWSRVLQVNLNTVFTLCRDVGAHMLTHTISPVSGRRGTIINVASLLSFQGGLTVPAYAASKGGIAQFTKALSNEWAGKGINVNAIAPGYIDTDMNEALIADEKRATEIMARIPSGRWGKPEDFKGVVVWLTSAAAGYVSGEIVVVDGGWMGR